MPGRATSLDEQLCFSLHAASRAVIGLYRERLDELGLTYTQYLVMVVLFEKRQVTIATLGEALLLDSATLSPVVKRLETHGLVTRRRDPEDERRVIVELTAAGDKIEPAISEVQQEVGRCTNLTDGAIDSLREQLHELIADLTDQRK